MRVALVGTGVAGQSHLLDLVTNPAFEVVAVVSRRFELAQQVADDYGVPAAYTNVEAMLTTTNPAAVVVATPPAVTPAIVRAVLDHGCWVLVDKPASASAVQINELAEHPRAASAVVGYNRRYQVQVSSCRALLSDAVALIRQVRCSWQGPFVRRYNSMDTHRHAAGFGDGVLLDTASHAFDTAIHLGLGPVAVVGARARQGGASGADVTAELLLTLTGSAQGSLEIRDDRRLDSDEWCIEVMSDRGHLYLNRSGLTGLWDGQSVVVAGSDQRRPVDDLLALSEGRTARGATLAEAATVLGLVDDARRKVRLVRNRPSWQRPRAKALGRLNGSC
jgi:predicted dehydrogenase